MDELAPKARSYLSAMNKAVKDYDRNRAKRIEALSHEKQQNELQIKNLVNNNSKGMASDITMQAINSQIEQLDKRNKGIVAEISAISSKEIEYA